MATTTTTTTTTTTLVELIRDNVGRFPAWVVYAALECSLIVLLLLDGFISFFSSGFAKAFGLHAPCLFCTRINHLFGKSGLQTCDPAADSSFYQDSICDAHALEVSFLAYCHVHRRLAHVSRMCKACLLSFAVSDDRSTSDAYRNLVDILGADFDDDDLLDHHYYTKVHHRISAPGPGTGAAGEAVDRCSCCGDPLRIKSSFLPRLVRMLSDSGGGRGEVAETPTTARDGDGSGFHHHPFAQVRYQGLRLTSDTESETAEEDVDELSSAVASENDDPGAKSNIDQHINLVQPSDVSAERGGPRLPTLSASKDTDDHRGFPSSAGYWSGSTGANMEVSEVKMTISVHKPGPAAGNKLLAGSKHGALLSPTPSPRVSMLRKRLSMKRHDLNSNNIGSGASGEGESLLHRLKRQVRLDRKSLLALCAELDQERSASAVAANQAMAMINRLQEEKAAVQMEALQYQRMMEEQAEYDQVALRGLRKLLAKRDRAIKALHADLRRQQRPDPPAAADDDDHDDHDNDHDNDDNDDNDDRDAALFAVSDDSEEESMISIDCMLNGTHNNINYAMDDGISSSPPPGDQCSMVRSRSSSFTSRRVVLELPSPPLPPPPQTDISNDHIKGSSLLTTTCMDT